MNRRFACFTLALLLASAAPAAAAPLDTALYDRLLEEHTRVVDDAAGVRVDYRALAESDGWKRLIANVDATNPDVLATRNEKLAFWINVYNILAIDLVVRNQPVDSIRDIGRLFRPVWDRPAGRVGRRRVTLDEIEHETLRPRGEPRLHVALGAFVEPYLPPDDRRWLARYPGPRIRYLRYDWDLNGLTDE